MQKKVLVVIFLLSSLIPAQKIQESTEKRIDLYISKVMKAYEMPGLAIGIVNNNKVVLAKGYGVRNIETKEPVTPTSLFHMASVSKPFTATAIMQFVEKGKVNLDDKVVKYLPYFKVDDEKYKEITIRQMLAHISGMPDVNNYGWDKPEYDDGAAERYVKSLAGEKLIGAPGEKFAYSNMAFEILGDLISKVSGTSFENYIKQNILIPLQMKNSTFLRKEVPVNLATSPHISILKTKVSEVYPYNRAHAPSSTLHSNIIDMCNWAIANMNKGLFKGNRILNASSYDILWTPTKNNNNIDMPVGLSWFIARTNSGLEISHGGGDTGYRTYLLMIPEKNFALVVLCNCENAPIRQIIKAITDITNGVESQAVKIPITIPIGRAIAEKNIETAVKQFRDLKEKQPGEYLITEELLNTFSYQLFLMNRLSDALEIMKLNAEMFPQSSNVYDSLGEVYMELGNKELAIMNYEKSLKLNPNNTNAAEIIKKLKK